MGSLLQDLRYGWRALLRRPGFTLVVVATIALGVGANTAIFSVANAVLLRPLPYQDPDRLVFLNAVIRADPGDRASASYRDIVDWREQNQVFEGVAAYANYRTLNLLGGEHPERVYANYISPSYLELLGVKPVLGRAFRPEEESTPGARPVVILSHGLWQRRFGGDPNLVGRDIRLSDLNYTVVGVLPAEFRDLHDTELPPDVWLPVVMAPTLFGRDVLEDRRQRSMYAIGRLKPGVTLEQAQAEMDGIGRRLAEQYRETNEGFGVAVRPLSEFFFGELHDPILALLVGSGFVLLIGCANIANLLLIRASARRKETAVRLALGATRRRLVKQQLTESLLLAALGGFLGVLLAPWGANSLLAFSAIKLPGFITVGVDGRVLAASLAVTLATGLAFGLAPALQSAKVDIQAALKQGTRHAGGAHSRTGSLLVVCEVASALVLLVGAGLMAQSLQRLRTTDLGFDPEYLLTVRLDLRSARYAEVAARRSFGRQLVEQTEALPGVEGVALWGPNMPGHATWILYAVPEGRPAQTPNDSVIVHRHHVSPGGLGSLGVPLLRGRDFTAQDAEGGVPVAVVSQSLARTLWPGQDAVGKRFRWTSANPNLPWVTVIGIAGDARHRQRTVNLPDRDVYFPYFQRPEQSLVLLVRTRTDAAAMTATLRQTVKKLDPELPPYDVATLAHRLSEQEARARFAALLMGLYALVALLLAALGIYGVLAYSVSQRTHELGVRLALGAQPRDVLTLVIRQGMVLTLTGLAGGAGLALALTRLIAGLLYGVKPTDPAVFAGVSLLLGVVALAACYVPARRAARVDPLVALRYE